MVLTSQSYCFFLNYAPYCSHFYVFIAVISLYIVLWKVKAQGSCQVNTLFSCQVNALFSLQVNTLFSLQVIALFSCSQMQNHNILGLCMWKNSSTFAAEIRTI